MFKTIMEMQFCGFPQRAKRLRKDIIFYGSPNLDFPLFSYLYSLFMKLKILMHLICTWAFGFFMSALLSIPPICDGD